VTTEDLVRTFILEQFYVADPSELTADASLIETGIVDSMGMMELVAFIQSNYAVALHDEELVPENLDSIARIAAFVERKRYGTFANAG